MERIPYMDKSLGLYTEGLINGVIMKLRNSWDYIRWGGGGGLYTGFYGIYTIIGIS